MKYLKMLGLAAVAAAALTAFVGAGTAQAYTLCKTGTSPCPGHYTVGTKFTATSATATLTLIGGFSGQTKMTCHSEVTVEQLTTGNDTGGAVTGNVTSLKWSNCVTDPSSIKCTATSSGLPYSGSISGSTLTVGSATETAVACEGGMNCTFTTEKGKVAMTIGNGNPATFTASEIKLGKKEGGFLCPTEAKWDATYTLNGTNTALFVSAT